MSPEQDWTSAASDLRRRVQRKLPSLGPHHACSDPFPQSALVKPSIPCPPLKKRTANHTAEDKPGEDSKAGKTPSTPKCREAWAKSNGYTKYLPLDHRNTSEDEPAAVPVTQGPPCCIWQEPCSFGIEGVFSDWCSAALPRSSKD